MTNGGPDMPVRVLIPGCGPGTLAHTLIAHLYADVDVFAKGPVHIDAFDIEPAAVSATRRNLAKFVGRPALSTNIFQADWNNNDIWSRLCGYNLVLFNPPYLASHELPTVRSGYEQTPIKAMDGGYDGLDHYRRVVPYLRDVLAEQSIATQVLFRFRTPGNDQTGKIRTLFEMVFKNTPQLLRLFPSEGPVAKAAAEDEHDRRWISFGTFTKNPYHLETGADYHEAGTAIDSCMALARTLVQEASRKLS